MEIITERKHVFKVGHLVRINKRIGFEPAGTLCLIYEQYSHPGRQGLSVITKDGIDLGGFGMNELHDIFSFVRDSQFYYNFANTAQLKMDWKNGLLNKAFEPAK